MKYCESSGEDTSQTSVLQFMQEGFIVILGCIRVYNV